MRAAMILCAGLGTRLRPLSDWLAKPMVPIGDVPAVEHIARRLRSSFEKLVVNVHHRPEDVRAWAGTSIAVSHEPILLGTAGGIAKAAPFLGDGDVLVWNGDILVDLDVASLIKAHVSDATLVVVPRPGTEGNVGLDDEGRIVRLRKESVAPETRSADFVGVQIVGARVRALLPNEGCIVGDVYIPELRRGARIDAHVIDVSFADIGNVQSYIAANRAWLGERSSWKHETAIVNAAVDGSVIGANARIDAPVLRSVVWPGTHVTAAHEDAVVTPFGVA